MLDIVAPVSRRGQSFLGGDGLLVEVVCHGPARGLGYADADACRQSLSRKGDELAKLFADGFDGLFEQDSSERCHSNAFGRCRRFVLTENPGEFAGHHGQRCCVGYEAGSWDGEEVACASNS